MHLANVRRYSGNPGAQELKSVVWLCVDGTTLSHSGLTRRVGNWRLVLRVDMTAMLMSLGHLSLGEFVGEDQQVQFLESPV